MGVKKFVSGVVDFLDLDHFSAKSKKKSIVNLLNKLTTRRKKIKKELDKTTSKKEIKKLEESLELIRLQIKKGKKYLKKLDDKN